MTALELPSRAALEQAEAFIARSRHCIPNPANVDIWLRAPESWAAYIIFARYIDQQQDDLRDRLAAQAMTCILSEKPDEPYRAERVGFWSYEIADAMLAARMEGRP